jgi:hypothetical protein
MDADLGLQTWYASETAKRAFGSICQKVDQAHGAVFLAGMPTEPLLVLSAASKFAPHAGEVILSVDEAKAEWSAVTTACSIYGTQFRIRGRKVMRAILTRHPTNRHPAERYFRSSSTEAEAIAASLERLALRVRKFGERHGHS